MKLIKVLPRFLLGSFFLLIGVGGTTIESSLAESTTESDATAWVSTTVDSKQGNLPTGAPTLPQAVLPRFADLAIGVHQEDLFISGNKHGAVNVLYGQTNGLSADGNQFLHKEETCGDFDDIFGFALAADDFNADGYSDLAIGVPGDVYFDWDLAKERDGAVYVSYGSISGLTASFSQEIVQSNEHGETCLQGDALIDLGGRSSDKEEFGNALATGDFNGDGYSDLAIGIPNDDDFSTTQTIGHGAVHIVYGTALGLDYPGNQFWTQDSPDVEDEADPWDRFGDVLAAGDFNGDGYSDLAIGVPQEDLLLLGNKHGMVNIIYGSFAGLCAACKTDNDFWHQNIDHVEEELDSNDLFGSALAAGDFNGDGYSDLAIGVPNEDIKFSGNQHGAVNVIYGSENGLCAACKTDNNFWHQDMEGIPGNGAVDEDRFGSALTAGDFNNDGYSDLAIGVPYENYVSIVNDSGAVNVIYGSANGLCALGEGCLEAQFWTQNSDGVEGEISGGEYFGSALASGDLNGDGIDDLAIGVPQEDLLFLGEEHGAINVLYGTTDGLSAEGNQYWHQDSSGVLDEADNNDQFGFSLAIGNFGRDVLRIFFPIVVQSVAP